MDAGEWMQVFGKAARLVVETSPFKGPNWYKD
jgi:hypothetical protein